MGEETDLEPLQIPAPAWMSGFWRETAALVRRLAGSALPLGACLEMVLAECGSAIPRDGHAARGVQPWAGEVQSSAPTSINAREADPSAPRQPRSEIGGLHCSASIDRSEAAGGDSSRHHGPGLLRSACESISSHESEADAPAQVGRESDGLQRSARSGASDPCTGSATRPAENADSAHGIDARAVDCELRLLITERQRQDAVLADHLRLIALDRGHRDLGFSSLEEYASERFSLSPRGLYYLLTLHRALDTLPALRRAFVAGRLTTRQTLLVGSVATSLTCEAWIRRAERVTLRRLEDEVTYWRALKESRHAVWELLDGNPPPEGIALVPGHPPRLHECARTDGPVAREGEGGTEHPADLQLSAPLDGARVKYSDAASADPDQLHSSASSHERRRPAAGGSSVSAEAFMRTIDEDEAVTPLPERMCTIRLRVEPAVREMWDSTVAHLRSTVRADLKEWEALALVLREFWRVWDNAETRRQRRENPTLDRDGWRCSAPGCWSIGTGRLHAHHIIPRAAGGEDDQANTTAVCAAHHVGLLHEGLVRCTGRAPDDLLWEMGVEPGREPFEVFRRETRITRSGPA